MSRRLVGGTLAASVLVGMSGAFAATQLPKADCATLVKDDPGDGKVNYEPVATGPAVMDPRGTSYDYLDILSVTLRSTPDKIWAYLSVKDVPTSVGATETAYQYDVTFAKGTKTVTLSHVLESTAAYWNSRPSGSASYPRAIPKDGSSQKPDLKGVTGELDATRNVVIVAVPRSELETFLGEPVTDGTVFTGVSARTWLYIGFGSGANQRPADSTAGGSYTVGDEQCFSPATVAATAGSVQYGDAATLSATVTGDGGAAIAGKQVTFSVAGDPHTIKATTDDNGVATASYVAAVPAGTYTATATFAGDETAGRASATTPLVVKPEATKFSPLAVTKSGTARTVTATLLDDDKRPVAGQKVDWYVGGRKVATLATTSAGKSVFKGAKAGQSVQARFAAVAGKYAATTSNTAKV
jgi:hypothetical protein